MERNHEGRGIIPLNPYVNEFGLLDSSNETNFDQLIDLIRGEDEANLMVNFNTQGHDCDQLHNDIGGESWIADQQFLAAPPVLDFNISTNHFVNDNTNFRVQDELRKEIEDETMDEKETMDEEELSSAATTTTNSNTPMKTSNNKVDRSRTLISERRRRSNMKEKLYNLRSLVPNITKMDKASIVGDAVLYVQDLQMQAKKLKLEIAGMESSMKRGDKYKLKTVQSSKKMKVTSSSPTMKKIYKIDILQLEERGFYVRIVSNKGKGIAPLLYRALDCLPGFSVKSSNLAASAENYAFNFNLEQSTDREMDVTLSDLKHWIGSVFLNQGFDFETSKH